MCAHTRTRFECWPTTKNKIDCRFGWSEENQTTTTTKKTDRRVDRRRKNLLSAYAYVYKCKFQAVFVTLVSAPKILKSRYCFVLFLFLLCFFLLLAYLLAFDIGRVWVYLYICAGLCVSFPFWLLLLYYIWVYDSHCWWWWQWSSVYCCKSIVIICFAVCCRHCRSAVIHKLNILVTYQQFVFFFILIIFVWLCLCVQCHFELMWRHVCNENQLKRKEKSKLMIKLRPNCCFYFHKREKKIENIDKMLNTKKKKREKQWLEPFDGIDKIPTNSHWFHF